MATFNIVTLGCKVNRFESDSIGLALINGGWSPVKAPETSDLFIINTCTVTGKAAMQSRQAIRSTIRANPDARIIVTGCYAQIDPDEIKKIDGVHDVVGHSDKLNIPNILISGDMQHSPCPDTAGELYQRNAFKQLSMTVAANKTRPFLKIQDGCNSFCTYCIVPLARGLSQSMPPDTVIENIMNIRKAGFQEIVLTGIHLGCYGLDLSPETTLLKLMREIEESRLLNRVRLSSIEPMEFSDEIIALLAESNIFCNHFHIPLQSGDDIILSKMGRPYTRSLFNELVLKIHNLIPDAGIGVDILAGFPGETDEAFENTYKLIKALPVTYLHVFPFSPRKGTPAENFSGKISPEIIKARCKRMRDLGMKKKTAFYESLIGKKTNVLIEGKKDAASGFLKGLTENYVPVLMDGKDELINTVITVKIESLVTRSERGQRSILLKGHRISDN